MSTTTSVGTMDVFIAEVAALVAATDDEHVITAQVAERLTALLASGMQLPREVTRPSTDRHVTYPEPTIVIHVHGGNIGTTQRRSYDPSTGSVEWFVSGWDSPPDN